MGMGGPNVKRGGMGKEGSRGLPTDRRKRSGHHERRIAKKLGLTLTPNSGATPMPGAKADFQSEANPYVVEHKGVRDKRIVVGPKVIGKVCREAANVGKVPILILTLEEMPYPYEREWVCVPIDTWEELTRHQRDRK